VSGNVSLYNETLGRGILPTPTIGGVGLLDDVTTSVSIAFKDEGEAIVLVGETQGWLGASSYLETMLGREDGAPPPVDLALERRHGEFVRGLITARRVSAAHDLSDGGLGIAVAEMAMAGRIGARIDMLPESVPAHAALFGEDQGRYLLTLAPDAAEAVVAEARTAGIPAQVIGTTGGSELVLPEGDSLSIDDLRTAHEGWLPAYMAGAVMES
jgi:phosphoribosylformylglycinamidine synthase